MDLLSNPTSFEQTNSMAEYYTKDEEVLLNELIPLCRLSSTDHEAIELQAHRYVSTLRSDESNEQLIDTFLQEYGLSTPEGLTLMRLAEALIRTPDFGTGRLLMRDKLNNGDWSTHSKQSDSFWVNQATSGLNLTKYWIKQSGGIAAENLAARLGDRAMGLGVARAMAMMGEHFVLGTDIKEAVKKSHRSESAGFTHSYDMLGEAAYTEKDAAHYFQAYLSAIEHLENDAAEKKPVKASAGISVKLSALHPRYEYAKKEDCVPLLLQRLVDLAVVAKRKNLGLTIDAEEADRLEISLLIFERLLQHPKLADWDGLGIVIQAYQRRASKVISSVIQCARLEGRKITVRLVKGAYWDMEIKRAQELGLSSYPVFTRKENTDISYVACTRLLLDAPDVIYPQFATHNALTAATIAYMAGDSIHYEFQRLHGMGEALHESLISTLGVTSRIYAPVGNHKDLLPYLVRRLLENGANSSFVNQLFDDSISVDEIVEDPFKLAAAHSSAANERIPAPTDTVSGVRQSASGLDITQSDVASSLENLAHEYTPYSAASLIGGKPCKSKPIDIKNPANSLRTVGSYTPAIVRDIDRAIKKAKASDWSKTFTPNERALCLERAATLLEDNMHAFLQLCTLEAGKSYLDGVAEVREAVDFCRYYAEQARSPKVSKRCALGTVACISPWNFPLAIFLGQITASLSVGNTVIAKPAEQTPLISHKAITLLFEAGVPHDAVHLIMGDGAVLGSYLTAHTGIDAICFTGSTATAKNIAANLADTHRSTIPLIAETGGINAMVVDSTALLEQAVQDVIDSAFQSAGQRCSACRFVCVQDEIADGFIEMLSGAMKTLQVGNPALLSTDVGPVIEASAQKMIESYITNMKARFPVIGISGLQKEANNGSFVQPIAFEIESISDLDREVFGPVLHVIRFKASNFESVIQDINKLGFGLTMGLHSRLDDRVDWVSRNAKVGNLYVNRNQIGAVVGVQPFGGEGLSGTGPKAGGPHYLLRLSSSLATPEYVASAPEENPHLKLARDSSPETAEALNRAKTASRNWSNSFSAIERKAMLKTAIGTVGDSNTGFWEKLDCETNSVLPGPTGESNTLKLHPRGVIICAGNRPSLLKQIALALFAGNSVIVTSDTPFEKISAVSEQLTTSSKGLDLIQVISTDKLSVLLNGPIDGVAVDGKLRNAIGEFLCKRDGAILPILSGNSDPERFFHERTVTINTTAAGGNATLLTLD